MGDRSIQSNRYNRKRGSFDSSNLHKSKPNESSKSKPRDLKKQIAELSIDLNPHKNLLTLHPRNQTYRLQQNDMCDLRSEVEQLRMDNQSLKVQNQSLKEQMRQIKRTEEDLKYEIMRVREDLFGKRQKYQRIEIQSSKMEEKLEKYSHKIKELYELLIEEKKKNSSIPINGFSRMKSAVSPSARSIKNTSLYYRQLEKEGERDYYSSATQLWKQDENPPMAWSMEHSDYSPFQNGNPRAQFTRQTFGNHF